MHATSHTHTHNTAHMASFSPSLAKKSKAQWSKLLACVWALVYGIWSCCTVIQGRISQAARPERAHITHATSTEWQTRKTQEAHYLSDESTRVTVYRNDFPGSTLWPDFWNVVSRNEWEASTFKIIKHFLEGYPGASYIDFGAWIGPTVLFAAQYCKRVYALEPDMQAFSALTANVNTNQELKANVALYHECINKQTGPMTFRGRGDSTSRFSDTSDWGDRTTLPEWTIPCRTLPEFVNQEGVAGLRLMKIDTEGAELYLLPSLVGWLQSLPHPKPSLWLSVHQPYWKHDVSLVSKDAFWAALGTYKYVYLEGITPMAVQGGDSKMLCNDFCSYLLTDEEFVMPL